MGKREKGSLCGRISQDICCVFKTYHASQAKAWNSLFLNRGDEDDVEVAARVISQAEQNLHTRAVVLHI